MSGQPNNRKRGSESSAVIPRASSVGTGEASANIEEKNGVEHAFVPTLHDWDSLAGIVLAMDASTAMRQTRFVKARKEDTWLYTIRGYDANHNICDIECWGDQNSLFAMEWLRYKNIFDLHVFA